MANALPVLTPLLRTHADAITALLVSDLHLAPDEPALMQAFLALLDTALTLPNLAQFWILGDWFAAWLGDDLLDTPTIAAWLAPMLARLRRLSQRGCAVLVLRGNRDFLLGQRFCATFGGQLLTEPYSWRVGKQHVRIEHGDALCTDDTRYQRFRAVIQNPLTKRVLLALPKSQRQRIATRLRTSSQQENHVKTQTAQHIMDVNSDAVRHALQHADVLLHGHTHRPAEHTRPDGKRRMVLGDWRYDHAQTVHTVIGVVVNSDLRLVEWRFTPTH